MNTIDVNVVFEMDLINDAIDICKINGSTYFIKGCYGEILSYRITVDKEYKAICKVSKGVGRLSCLIDNKIALFLDELKDAEEKFRKGRLRPNINASSLYVVKK